jgi:hypothetical protein
MTRGMDATRSTSRRINPMQTNVPPAHRVRMGAADNTLERSRFAHDPSSGLFVGASRPLVRIPCETGSARAAANP